jgi:hypothetical protein
VIDVSSPLPDGDAVAWLDGAGERDVLAGFDVLNWALDAYRVAAAEPGLHAITRGQALGARIGYGAGEEVADGRWSAVRELDWEPPRRPRRRMLSPEARMAALLTGRERPLVCEELALRARRDIDQRRPRHAALSVLVALDAAIAELTTDTTGPELRERIDELRSFRDPVGAAAQAALAATPSEEQQSAVQTAVERIEAALRARAAARR